MNKDRVEIKNFVRLDSAKTAMVCTISPVLDYGHIKIDEGRSKERVREILDTDMKVIVRINFSHVKTNVDRTNIRKLMKIVRQVSRDLRKPVGIMMDICGPRVRIGELKNPVRFTRGGEFVLADETTVKEGEIPLNATYPQFYQDIKVGDTILIDEGRLRAVIRVIENKRIVCKEDGCVTPDYELTSNKSINTPESNFSGPVLTDKDDKDLAFAMKLKDDDGYHLVDYLAQSFVRSAGDYDFLSDKVRTLRTEKIPIIAKIETEIAMKNIRYIAQKYDGIMVARGDLGVNTSYEKVPEYQDRIVKEAKLYNKPVIVATQMLESMLRLSRLEPLRAEGTDVWLAAKEADAVMTSAETVQGDQPGNIIRAISRISKSAEASRAYSLPSIDARLLHYSSNSSYLALAHAVCLIADNQGCKAIVISTFSGDGTKYVSAYRPAQPIIAITTERTTALELLLYSGIYPVLVEPLQEFTTEEYMSTMKDILVQLDLRGKGKRIVSLFGIQPGQSPIGPGVITNTIRLFGLD